MKNNTCIGGGKCEECGKCNLKDSTGRKKNLTYLPDDFVPDAEPFGEGVQPLGIAFDIGTTTVVAMFWDLKERTLIDTIAKTNPQSTYGADVISRITYSSESEDRRHLMQAKIINCFNEMIEEFLSIHKWKEDSFIRATVVGNTTMSHLFLGVDASSLARAPFEPAFYGPVLKRSSELGIRMNPDAEIHILPNIAGHVGSDILGVLFASGMRRRKGLTLAIDVGTNGEIVLALNGRLMACSTAAGPAFEGACIHQGMRAAKGSIERVKIENGEVKIQVIEGAAPIGICGSGLIDTIAQMLDAGILNYKGNIVTKEAAVASGMDADLAERLRKGIHGNEFVLVWQDSGKDIVITQKDIREVQLAKGAIYGGIVILMQCMNTDPSQLEEILLAGAFGSYIDKKSALRIGMLPNVREEKITYIGNAAGVGACMALLSENLREQAAEQAQEVEHVELALHPNFEKEYLNAMYFPRQYPV
ncbi:ASKHA domain-containing protein [Sinanaerobacter chloroacetimidivorans]|uniref:DUF4445 domain-containing protein n=1 Tax=Sinanaerobacter chloroacetimidivorans TaxID=2818044 RepID=A0A8J8B2J7_9FIRM|nr:ASKHA domain-containing protein [Sinanaerobacter chloroacetimidivorans]MBR0598807.1 DUF4445 domain-containing protein [Sinanaerobacter chloroacetimidivorans]